MGIGNLCYREIINACIFFIAMPISIGIAFIKGYFKLDREEKVNIKTYYVISVFFLCFFLSFIISYGAQKILQNNSVLFFSVLVNWLWSILIILSLILFCFKADVLVTKRIIKKESSNSFYKDAFVGIYSWLIIFPVVSFVTSICNVFILLIFKLDKLPEQSALRFIRLTASNPMYFFLMFLLVVFIAPLIEEFLFRSVLQNYIKKFVKRSLAILLTSLIFALVHYVSSQGLANLSILGPIFILSCFLGFLYEKQQSLISPFFLHSTFNAITILNMIFIKEV